MEGGELCDLEGSAGKARSRSCTPQRPPRATTRLRTPPPRDLAPRSPKPLQVPSPHPFSTAMQRNRDATQRNAVQWNSVKFPSIVMCIRIISWKSLSWRRALQFITLRFAVSKPSSSLRRRQTKTTRAEGGRHATSPWVDEWMHARNWIDDKSTFVFSKKVAHLTPRWQKFATIPFVQVYFGHVSTYMQLPRQLPIALNQSHVDRWKLNLLVYVAPYLTPHPVYVRIEAPITNHLRDSKLYSEKYI